MYALMHAYTIGRKRKRKPGGRIILLSGRVVKFNIIIIIMAQKATFTQETTYMHVYTITDRIVNKLK